MTSYVRSDRFLLVIKRKSMFSPLFRFIHGFVAFAQQRFYIACLGSMDNAYADRNRRHAFDNS